MKSVLITGGAGFVGTNLAHHFATQGIPVLLYDNLSRPGVEQNVQWLRTQHPGKVALILADIRDRAALARAVAEVGAVFHFAAQVAVTSSLVNPIEDFRINAGGTLSLLESLRALKRPPPLIFTSTNKVYGALDDLEVTAGPGRYVPLAPAIAAQGVSEERPLSFHSPYGCSKGTADQYVLDYARTFGMQTVVFRMSCIYGPHQFGNEDQGWVAHFLIRSLLGETLTLYGDGKQVRDVLFVEDLVEAFALTLQNIERLSGQAFNIGGGPRQTLSLLELLELIGAMDGRRPRVSREGWRTGDQRYYVSDTRKFQRATGWAPKVGVGAGVGRLQDWLRESQWGARRAAGEVA